jgi:bifunctional lysine-specific demethylase and histidyl-hydroxylase NO66
MAATPTQTRATRTPSDATALARAIAPVEPDRFLVEHWERQPLVVARGEQDRFVDLLSPRDLERLLTETSIRTPGFRLVKAGATVSGYTSDLSWRPDPFTGVADVRRVLAEFENGATVVLQGLHHSWLPLARYCRLLEAFLGHPAQAGPPRHARGALAPGRR